MKKTAILALVCAAGLQKFIVEDLNNYPNNPTLVAVCEKDRLRALVAATRATVWSEKEWKENSENMKVFVREVSE